MTSSRYFIARFAQAFGYIRRSHRLADAAREMHLLREAEAQLGAAIWEKVEGVEALSVEYWNMRKIIKEKELVRTKLEDCQVRLDQAHEERETVLNSTPEVHQELVDQRVALLIELENLSRWRDEIVAEAREVRRTYDGMQIKLEVLTEESTGEESNLQQIEQVRSHLAEIKAKFSELKHQRIQIGNKIEEGDAKVDIVDEHLNEKKLTRRTHASEAFQVIGEGNKEMSILRAESGLLDIQMRQLYAEIGRFISRHAFLDPVSAKVASSHQGLVDVMRVLRRSIALNHRLAGIA